MRERKGAAPLSPYAREGGTIPTFIGESVIAALKTKLATIGDGSTTWAQTTIPTVIREHDWARATRTLPLIIIGRHSETFTRHSAGSSNIYKVDATVDVAYLFDAAAWAPDTDAAKATHDLFKAVRDHNLGIPTQCFDCTITSAQTIIPNQGEEPQCGVRAQFRLEYFMNEDDPSVWV